MVFNGFVQKKPKKGGAGCTDKAVFQNASNFQLRVSYFRKNLTKLTNEEPCEALLKRGK